MNYQQYLVILLFVFVTHWATAQPNGEASEPSPEELDAAFTAEDAAREAAGWSDVIIDRNNSDPLGAMAAVVDLVFRGTVVSQQVVYDADGVPFTHTTFSISEALKGAYPETEITVIQEGGPSQNDPDSIVITSDAKHFNVDEEEMLFLGLNPAGTVAANRISIEHRFRVYEGKVYGENGRGLIVTPSSDGTGHRLAWSRDRNPAPQFRKIQIGEHTLTKNFTAQENNNDSSSEEAAQGRRIAPGYQSSVDVSTFSAAITD